MMSSSELFAYQTTDSTFIHRHSQHLPTLGVRGRSQQTLDSDHFLNNPNFTCFRAEVQHSVHVPSFQGHCKPETITLIND